MSSLQETERLFFADPKDYTCLFFSASNDGKDAKDWIRSRFTAALADMGVDIREDPRTWGAGLYPILMTVWNVRVPRDLPPREYRAFLDSLPQCLVADYEFDLAFASRDTRRAIYPQLMRDCLGGQCQCLVQRPCGYLLTFAARKDETIVIMKMGNTPLPGERGVG